MAIIITAGQPSALLDAIYAAIDEVHVATWSYDDDGDLTYLLDEWRESAWFRPETTETELQFGLVKRLDEDLTTHVYSVYHSAFVQMLLNHFDDQFTTVVATARHTPPDEF